VTKSGVENWEKLDKQAAANRLAQRIAEFFLSNETKAK